MTFTSYLISYSSASSSSKQAESSQKIFMAFRLNNASCFANWQINKVLEMLLAHTTSLLNISLFQPKSKNTKQPPDHAARNLWVQQIPCKLTRVHTERHAHHLLFLSHHRCMRSNNTENLGSSFYIPAKVMVSYHWA